MLRRNLQDTMDELRDFVRSGYAIYIVTHEEERVVDYLVKLTRVLRNESNRKLITWKQGMGFNSLQDRDGQALGKADQKASDKLKWLEMTSAPVVQTKVTVRSFGAPGQLDLPPNAVAALKERELEGSMVVFFDLHPFLASPDGRQPGSEVRSVRNAIATARSLYRSPSGSHQTLIFVAPSAAGLTPELEKDLVVIDFPLPDRDELKATTKAMLDDKSRGLTLANPGQATDLLDDLASAGRGLALHQFREALTLVSIKKGPLEAEHVKMMLDRKADTINNDALRYTPSPQIELGGLENVTEWIEQRADPARSKTVRDNWNLPTPRGLLLCGASGGGKSQLAKYTAQKFGLALLQLDVGALFGQYVGQSEERTRHALQLAELLAPVVLWVDELDKAFNVESGDQGVSARVIGYILTWLAEKTADIFIVATANNIASLDTRFPEFFRRGRFDELFWIGLPGPKARRKIFDIYLTKMVGTRLAMGASGGNREALLDQLSDDGISGGLTGAEIEYAVTDALYSAYNLKQEQLPIPVLMKAVEQMWNRRMYNNDQDPKLGTPAIIQRFVQAEDRTKAS